MKKISYSGMATINIISGFFVIIVSFVTFKQVALPLTIVDVVLAMANMWMGGINTLIGYVNKIDHE